MGFGTPPHPVAGLFPDHIASWGDMSCIFQISELNFVDDYLAIAILPIDEDVVWFYIYKSKL